MSMVRACYIIVSAQVGADAHCDSFLTRVQVNGSWHQVLTIQLEDFLFEESDG
jgi:hypothetical protein